MRFEGRISKHGRYWAVEVPILGVQTQGRTRAEAFVMVADAIESLFPRKRFRVEVFPGNGGYFEVGSSDEGTLTALLLRRQRTMHGLTLEQVAKRLGAKSHNAYARYEQGRSVPSVKRFGRLLAAVGSGTDFVLKQSLKFRRD